MNTPLSSAVRKKSILNRALMLGLVGLCAVSTAQAAFTDYGNYTHDTTTSLDWLALDQTLNMSFADVTAATGAGGALAGWQYASLSQFTTLAREVLDNPNYQGDSNSNATLEQATQMFNIVGGSYNGRTEINGMMVGGVFGGVSIASDSYWINGQLGNATAAGSWYGSFLVRDHVNGATVSSVPEPAMSAMFGLGIGALALMSRRRQRKA